MNRQTDIPCLPAVADLPEFRGTGAERLRFIQLRARPAAIMTVSAGSLISFPVLLCRNAIRRMPVHRMPVRAVMPFHSAELLRGEEKVHHGTAQVSSQGRSLSLPSSPRRILSHIQPGLHQNDYILSNLFPYAHASRLRKLRFQGPRPAQEARWDRRRWHRTMAAGLRLLASSGVIPVFNMTVILRRSTLRINTCTSDPALI